MSAMHEPMKGPFATLHARALCHATEVLDRVMQAVRTAVGDVELETTRTSGHHGNEIAVVEAHSADPETMRHVFQMLSPEDRAEILRTLPQRLDESCNLFIRVDKQEAFLGTLRLSSSEDVIAIRMKVTAYPAKKEVAEERVAEYLRGLEATG